MSNQLKNRLINQGVVSESTFNEVPSSFAWPIKLLLAICGWLGGLCLLGIFFGAFTLFFQSAVASAVVALIMFVVAQRILSAPNNEFIEHLGLALSFSAQVLYGWALLPLEHVQVILLSFAILQAVLVLIMPSMTHRVWSTLSCCAAISGVLISCGLPSLLSSVLLLPMVWLSLNEFRFPASYRFVSGIKYGLVLSIVVLLCAEVFRAEVGSLLVSNADAIFTLPYWVAPIAYMLSICISVGYLLCYHQVWFRSKVVKLAVIFTILIAVLTSMAPGVGASLIILVTAFAQSNRMMIGLGAIALLVYSSTYYYIM